MKTKNLLSNVLLMLTLIYFFPNSTFSQGTWIQQADFPGGARYSAIGFSIGTKIYIGIGFNDGDWSMSDFWEWDQTTNIWTKKANYPGRIRGSAVSFSIGTKGYVITADEINTDSIAREFWEFDPATDRWTRKAYFPGDPRDNAAGFSIGNKGYIGSGSFYDLVFRDLVYYNDFWEYDQETDTWTRKAAFGGGARTDAVGFSIGNKGYIGMGSIEGFQNNTLLKDFWEWDQATNTWTQKADFEGVARYGTVGFSLEKSGYIGTGSNNGLYNDFWEWNQATDAWTQRTTFGGMARANAVGFSIGSKGYVGTGGTGVNPNYALQDFWEFDPSAITGIEEFSNKEILIYPNPTNGKFSIKNIDMQLKDFNLEIYDILGKKIYSDSRYLPQTSNEIDLSNSPRGIYFVKINDGKKFYTGKITVQ